MDSEQNSAPPAGAAVSPEETLKPVPLSPERDIEENKDIAAFSYVWIMSVIIYFLKKDSPFVQFHSKQAMILFFLTIPVWMIPVTFIARILELVLLAGMVAGLLNAAQGKKKDVPFVGPLSRREMTVREAWREFLSIFIRLANVAKHFFGRAKKAAKDAVPKDAPPSPPPPPAPTL